MPTSLSRILFRPTVWIVAAAVLVAVDLFAPARLAVYVLTLLLLPAAWRMLHRRHVPQLTAVLMVAVAIPGAVAAISRSLERQASPPRAVGGADEGGAWPIEPARLWTLASLAGAGLFHTNLQRDRRRRLALRQGLQRRVRRRTNQVWRANRALRNEVARRQETEHLLDRSENRFQALMDRMQLQVTRKNPDGVIIYANETFCRNLGVSAADVIGRTDADLFPSDLATAYRDDDVRVMKTGHAVDQVEEHPVLKGRPGFVQVFKAPEYDQDGECSGVQIIFWDITQKHRAEMALRDSEARKRALFEAAGDAMLLVDAEGVIVEANPSAAELFHQTVADLVGQSLNEVAAPVDQPAPEIDAANGRGEASVEGFETPARDRIPWDELAKTKRHEMKLARADGSAFEGEVTVHAIPVGPGEGMAILVRDVTLRRRAFQTLRNAKAAAEAANRTKTEFMAGVSHELRTPLGGITGLAELLSNADLSHRDRQYVELIRHSASLLSDVIEDILDFAAIEAGRLQISPAPLDLHRVVAEAFECLSTRASEKPLRLVLAIDPETPRHVIADAKRIRQIVINLAGNAVKFTARGEVRLRLAVDTSQATGSAEPIAGADRSSSATRPVVIEVTDTGIGIAPENQARVFNAFERGEKGTTRVYGGTGLGLSISQKLARRMGGDITLTSCPGEGSTFRCTLVLPSDPTPAQGTRAGSARHHAAPAAGDRTEGAPAEGDRAEDRVLIDTGCASMNAAFSSTLRHHGFDCHVGDEIDAAIHRRSARRAFTWIIAHTMAEQWSPLRQRNDRVVWINRIGEPLPADARPNDPVLVEPVAPDKLWNAISENDSSPNQARSQATGSSDSAKPDWNRQPMSRRVLLVDDSEVNRIVIRDILSQEGFEVDVVSNGHEAIRRLTEVADSLPSGSPGGSARSAPYGCILMDLQMPDMDGTAVSRRIRQLLYRRRRAIPPIVALTAHVTEEHRRQCAEAGMEGFLTKPINPQHLIAEVRQRIPEASVEATQSLSRNPHTLTLSNADPGEKGQQEPRTHSPARPSPSGARETGPSRSSDNHAAASHPPGPQTPNGSQWRERMKAHGGNQPDIVVSLCDAFLVEVPTLVQQVRAAVRDQNPKRLRTAAHTLKSCLRYVAEPEDVAVAAEIEAASNAPDEVAPDQLDQIESIAEHWLTRVRQLRAEQQAELNG